MPFNNKKKRFSSKQQGYQAAVKVWQCKNCKNPVERYKPTFCKICNFNDFYYFASRAEFKRNAELEMFLKLGKITNLQRQIKYRFIHNGVTIGSYTADFVYKDFDGQEVVEDVKGHEKAIANEFELKRNLMRAFFGVNVKTVIYKT